MISLPAIKVFIPKQYLIPGGIGHTKGYLVAVDARPNSFLRFTVYLESGALWSGLPIEAICDIECKAKYPNDILQPFSCLEGPVSVCEISLIKNAEVATRVPKERGRYLFTINYEGTGLAEDPEQYKSHNIIALKSGQFAAMPNNYLSFSDNWLLDEKTKDEKTKYKRTTKRYECGG